MTKRKTTATALAKTNGQGGKLPGALPAGDTTLLADLKARGPCGATARGGFGQPRVWTEESQKLQQPGGKLDSKILPQPVAEIPWGHNVLLLQMSAYTEDQQAEVVKPE